MQSRVIQKPNWQEPARNSYPTQEPAIVWHDQKPTGGNEHQVPVVTAQEVQGFGNPGYSPYHEPEVTTVDEERAQLDLANAYINMGEEGEAKRILEGLLASENEKIRDEAEYLMQNLS